MLFPDFSNTIKQLYYFSRKSQGNLHQTVQAEINTYFKTLLLYNNVFHVLTGASHVTEAIKWIVNFVKQENLRNTNSSMLKRKSYACYLI